MSLTSFRSGSGRLVLIESMLCFHTYEAVEIGHPTKGDTPATLRYILWRVNACWPNVAVAFLNANDDDGLPPYCVALHTTSTPFVHDSARQGGQLVMILFVPDPPFSPNVATDPLLTSFQWETAAQDCDW